MPLYTLQFRQQAGLGAEEESVAELSVVLEEQAMRNDRLVHLLDML
jgi:hypothetical protein